MKNNEFKSQLFGKYNKMNEPVARLVKTKGRKLKKKIVIQNKIWDILYRYYRI